MGDRGTFVRTEREADETWRERRVWMAAGRCGCGRFTVWRRLSVKQCRREEERAEPHLVGRWWGAIGDLLANPFSAEDGISHRCGGDHRLLLMNDPAGPKVGPSSRMLRNSHRCRDGVPRRSIAIHKRPLRPHLGTRKYPIMGRELPGTPDTADRGSWLLQLHLSTGTRAVAVSGCDKGALSALQRVQRPPGALCAQ